MLDGFYGASVTTHLGIHNAHGIAAVVGAGAHADDRRRRERLDVHLDGLAAAAGGGAEVDGLDVGAVTGIDPVAARGVFHPVVDALGG